MTHTNLIDCTLREGSQAPGVKFSTEDSVEIASQLDLLGVQTIEAGHPFISEAEFNRVKAVVDLNLNARILAHARAREEDILAAHRAGVDDIGIFVGINARTRKVLLSNRTEQEVLHIISQSITFAKHLGLNVRYTVEDSARTEMSSLLQAYETAIQSGADRICFSDSAGSIEPTVAGERISSIRKKFPDIPLEVHFHDDRGLALANTLAAIDAGANWVSCSVNGIGERAGITDTLSLLTNLHYRNQTIDKIPSYQLLKHVSNLVNSITRSTIYCRQPIVGKNTNIHTAKLHKDAVRKDPTSYAWISPEKLGISNILNYKNLPDNYKDYIVKPDIISAEELKYHRHGPGDRYVMIDERYVSDSRMYSIVRKVYGVTSSTPGHVDAHRHNVDSFFLFLSNNPDMSGLSVEVALGKEKFKVDSPACVFIPSGLAHSYRVLSGEGLFVNTVFSGSYNDSLLEYATTEKAETEDMQLV